MFATFIAARPAGPSQVESNLTCQGSKSSRFLDWWILVGAVERLFLGPVVCKPSRHLVQKVHQRVCTSLLVIEKWGVEILAISKSYVLSGVCPIGLKQLARCVAFR